MGEMDQAIKVLENEVVKRVRVLEYKISNQKLDLDWLQKNKDAIVKLSALPNMKLVQRKWELEVTVKRIEKDSAVRRPGIELYLKSLRSVIYFIEFLADCSTCIVHVLSQRPLQIEMIPAFRLEIRGISFRKFNKFPFFLFQSVTETK